MGHTSQRSYKRSFALAALAFSCVNGVHAASADLYGLTLAIVSYSKWNNNEAPHICVLNNSQAANVLTAQVKQMGYSYKVSAINHQQLNQFNCQVIFFSAATPFQQQQIIKHYAFKNVLSLSSNNNDCEIGSIICFYSVKNKYSFKINLDALAQSKVHIDPRVLLLAKNAEASP